MAIPTCTRRIEFDTAHRITRHDSKCRNLHGHRYALEVTCRAAQLNEIGMVIDFGVIKRVVGGWIDEHLDHGVILDHEDRVALPDGSTIPFADLCRAQGWKTMTMKGEPTSENMALMLKAKAADLLAPYGIEIAKVRLYETPNCWAEV